MYLIKRDVLFYSSSVIVIYHCLILVFSRTGLQQGYLVSAFKPQDLYTAPGFSFFLEVPLFFL